MVTNASLNLLLIAHLNYLSEKIFPLYLNKFRNTQENTLLLTFVLSTFDDIEHKIYVETQTFTMFSVSVLEISHVRDNC